MAGAGVASPSLLVGAATRLLRERDPHPLDLDDLLRLVAALVTDSSAARWSRLDPWAARLADQLSPSGYSSTRVDGPSRIHASRQVRSAPGRRV